MDRPSVAECARLLAEAPPDALADILERFRTDERKGVRDACARASRRLSVHRDEMARLDALWAMERDLHARGVRVVAGVDEVGRGALAGPVTAGAAVLAADQYIPGLDDSKRLTARQRRDVASAVYSLATAVSVAHVEATDIDRLGIVGATREAMRLAIESLGVAVDHVLVDGNDTSLGFRCTAVIDGDAKCAAIAAASVVAKVARDDLMSELAERYPEYGLASHKGYSTPEHLAAIREFGPSEVHRRSFEPCRQDPTLF